VFVLHADGSERVLHSFSGGSDGQGPFGGVVLDNKGNLYGTTVNGGANGAGTVFKVSPNGAETILHNFAVDGVDGFWPEAGLIIDENGNLYGTTIHGGANDGGTVFEVRPNGAERVLHSFGSGSDGAYPEAGLARDQNGSLYGTTFGGGTNGYGSVFVVSSNGLEKVLHSFSNDGEDGNLPVSGVVLDSKGNIYGTTNRGGLFDLGSIFEISAQRGENVLYSFGTHAGDGYYPDSTLIIDKVGNLYGTTPGGGPSGWGTVFKFSVNGVETILHNFINDGLDGITPYAGLTLGDKGRLYGTTNLGGAFNGGTVFFVAP